MIDAVDIGTGGTTGQSFTHGTLTRWCLPSDGVVVIDLSRVAFIDTMGLVTVAAAAERAQLDGIDVQFTPPRDADPARYAARMHLGECLASVGVDAQLPTVHEREVGSRLTELHRFDAWNADELAERVHYAVVAHAGDEANAKEFFLGVSEVMWNVVDHSTVGAGWAAMQVMPGDKAPFVTFAVADSGVGLRQSLARNHSVTDDSAAISLAFESGVSGTGDRRGMGLPDLYHRVNRRRGVIKVWSGNATGTSRLTQPVRVGQANTSLAGTIIYSSFKPGKTEEVGR